MEIMQGPVCIGNTHDLQADCVLVAFEALDTNHSQEVISVPRMKNEYVLHTYDNMLRRISNASEDQPSLLILLYVGILAAED